jgi:sterol desaturase/sphingolipid hydroxylase (fatty acid hydroxylase superfamily)
MDENLLSLLDVLARPVLDPRSRTWWGGLLVTGLIALVYWRVRRPRTWTRERFVEVLRHPSTQLDLQLYVGRQIFVFARESTGIAGSWWLATSSVMWLDRALGKPSAPDWSEATVAILYSLALFLVWDFSRWLLHWLAHRVPFLWAFHQVHHSAEVMTPLSFHRIHPVESALAQARGVLATAVVASAFYWVFRERATHLTLLGAPAIGMLLNALTGNLRHSHVWIPFPHWLERWLLSPAQHQIHHSADPRECHTNMGTWLAIWDRMAGTFSLSDQPPVRYGVPDGERNHGDDLISAWFGPFVAVLTRRPAAEKSPQY